MNRRMMGGVEDTMHCDPHYNNQADYELQGDDEPESDRISRPDDICPPTLRDPNADAEAAKEYERAIYADHCCDQDDAAGDPPEFC